MIDWTNPECLVTSHFTVKECLWLHKWERLACEADGLSDEVKNEIVKLCSIMETIRTLLQAPIITHSFFRSRAYNLLIGSPQFDVHYAGKAIDFDCSPILTILQVKEKLRPNLERYGIRLENNGPLADWVHVDTKKPSVSGRREFLP